MRPFKEMNDSFLLWKLEWTQVDDGSLYLTNGSLVLIPAHIDDEILYLVLSIHVMIKMFVPTHTCKGVLNI